MDGTLVMLGKNFGDQLLFLDSAVHVDRVRSLLSSSNGSLKHVDTCHSLASCQLSGNKSTAHDLRITWMITAQ